MALIGSRIAYKRFCKDFWIIMSNRGRTQHDEGMGGMAVVKKYLTTQKKDHLNRIGGLLNSHKY